MHLCGMHFTVCDSAMDFFDAATETFMKKADTDSDKMIAYQHTAIALLKPAFASEPPLDSSYLLTEIFLKKVVAWIKNAIIDSRTVSSPMNAAVAIFKPAATVFNSAEHFFSPAVTVSKSAISSFKPAVTILAPDA